MNWPITLNVLRLPSTSLQFGLQSNFVTSNLWLTVWLIQNQSGSIEFSSMRHLYYVTATFVLCHCQLFYTVWLEEKTFCYSNSCSRGGCQSGKQLLAHKENSLFPRLIFPIWLRVTVATLTLRQFGRVCFFFPNNPCATLAAGSYKPRATPGCVRLCLHISNSPVEQLVRCVAVRVHMWWQIRGSSLTGPICCSGPDSWVPYHTRNQTQHWHISAGCV